MFQIIYVRPLSICIAKKVANIIGSFTKAETIEDERGHEREQKAKSPAILGDYFLAFWFGQGLCPGRGASLHRT
jgi:hypothetical protein